MDVLNPELKWIENRCYRVLPLQDSSRSEEEEDIHSSTFIQEDDDYDPDLPILHQGNKFYITIHVPTQLFGLVRGKYSKMLNALEKYGAKVTIPSKNDKVTIPSKNAAALITISGSTTKVVSDAYHRIEDIVFTSRMRTNATHFISLPVNFPEIKESFLQFKKEVLENYIGVKGVDESIFQNPNKLHVTIAPLVLFDERDNQNAISILKNCADNILKDLGVKELRVQVKGIEYMNDDPAEVDVLYAKLNELNDDNCLKIIAENIVKEFTKPNLSKLQNDNVKLHITIMNTLFRVNLEEQDDNLQRITFDAKGILRDFGDYHFGQIVISEVHLSVRYTTAVDGYYVALHKIKLNQ